MNRRDLREIMSPGFPYRATTTQLDMGAQLRDLALDKSKQGREERIERVRALLVAQARARAIREREFAYSLSGELTADDVWEAAHDLGYTEGDTRWLSHVTRHWGMVVNTHRYVPSRLKQRHARPIPVFRWV